MEEGQIRENIGRALAEAGKKIPEIIIQVLFKNGESFYAQVFSDSIEYVRPYQTTFFRIVGDLEKTIVPKEVANKEIASISYVSPLDFASTVIDLIRLLEIERRKNTDKKEDLSLGAIKHIMTCEIGHLLRRGKSKPRRKNMGDILQGETLTMDAIKKKCKKGDHYVMITKKDKEKLAAHLGLLEDKVLVLDVGVNEHFLSSDELEMTESIQFFS